MAMLNCTYLLIVFFILMNFNPLIAQTSDQDGHHHEHADYELGLSLGMTRLVEEAENALSSHLHFSRKLGGTELLERFSLGLGFEYIFTKHPHYSVVGTISINPIWALIVDISPGVLITEHDGSKEKLFVTHLELTYEFDYQGFGIGPVVGAGFSEEDNHLMIGLHIGKGF
ncbi:MAG: hypothetical protein JW956_13730 [Calditrichaceae bacterium]|nr:hypothetical protein [Calditrichaceae bacterium]